MRGRCRYDGKFTSLRTDCIDFHVKCIRKELKMKLTHDRSKKRVWGLRVGIANMEFITA